MNVTPTSLPGVLVVEPKVFGDARGFFLESWHQQRYVDSGLPEKFVQDNLSSSRRGVLRGLHLQSPNPQGKLIYVLSGEVFDVVVDIRKGSPTFGKWFGLTLSGENKKQVYIPPGLAHGFCVTSEEAVFAYKCTDYYNPKGEISLRWDDPAIGIQWPMTDVSLSAKDAAGVNLADLDPTRLISF